MYLALIAVLMTQSNPFDISFENLLDVDGDGLIHPMEAADALQMILKETNQQALPINEIGLLLQDFKDAQREEAEDFIEEFDINKDHVLTHDEIPNEFRSVIAITDSDQDGQITSDEVMQLHPDSEDVWIAIEAEEILEDFDDDEDGKIRIKDLLEYEPELGEMAQQYDKNKDSSINKEELIVALKEFDKPASFLVTGSQAEMFGTINESTPFRVMELVFYHPEVETIVMADCPGSIDDDSCLRAARIVRLHGLNTHVPMDGEVASGGTDFFQAGVKRTCERGALFGIHSWSAYDGDGDDLPFDSEEHQMYLEYCDEMGIPQSFYWRTLEAASADDIHWMTEEELQEFKMLTSPIIQPQ